MYNKDKFSLEKLDEMIKEIYDKPIDENKQFVLPMTGRQMEEFDRITKEEVTKMYPLTPKECYKMNEEKPPKGMWINYNEWRAYQNWKKSREAELPKEWENQHEI